MNLKFVICEADTLNVIGFYSFSKGTITLIAKRTCDLEKLEKPDQVLDRLLHVCAKKEYKPQCSLVRKSLQ